MSGWKDKGFLKFIQRIQFKTTQVENGIEWLTTFKEQWNNRSRDLECDSVDSHTKQILQTKKI